VLGIGGGGGGVLGAGGGGVLGEGGGGGVLGAEALADVSAALDSCQAHVDGMGAYRQYVS
jgi:hypothetical protein